MSEERIYEYDSTSVSTDVSEVNKALAEGKRVQMDERMQDYYLDELPPQFMGRVVELVDGTKVFALFGSGENADPIVAFWTDREGRHFAQRTKLIARD